MPRYVILEHTGTPTYKPGRHLDLMLESDGVLRTWELPATPSADTRIQAVRLPDHRLEYLDYEGPVSNNRGSVRRWDAGEYLVLSETDKGLTIRLAGHQLQGRLVLSQSHNERDQWQLSFETAN